MTTSYGITGIGYPMMGLGNFGLSPTGSFASYDNSMMGLYGTNGSVFGANPMMYGMYNPLYLGQMSAQMEKNQLNHTNYMHTNLMNSQVQATTETDRALVSKMLTNASIERGIDNLRQKVLEGDQDGICNEFDQLRNQIYATYKDELAARGSEENPYTAAGKIIENLYGTMISAKTGQTCNLRTDIEAYGKGAGTTGFMQGFRSGHHDRYVDETLNHCFGLDIDNRGSKELTQGACKIGGHITSVVEKGVIGAGVGAAGYGLVIGASKALKVFGCNGLKFNGTHLGRAAVITAVACMIGDAIWKFADRDTEKS